MEYLIEQANSFYFSKQCEIFDLIQSQVDASKRFPSPKAIDFSA